MGDEIANRIMLGILTLLVGFLVVFFGCLLVNAFINHFYGTLIVVGSIVVFIPFVWFVGGIVDRWISKG